MRVKDARRKKGWSGCKVRLGGGDELSKGFIRSEGGWWRDGRRKGRSEGRGVGGFRAVHVPRVGGWMVVTCGFGS